MHKCLGPKPCNDQAEFNLFRGGEGEGRTKASGEQKYEAGDRLSAHWQMTDFFGQAGCGEGGRGGSGVPG